ncbi:ribosomal RNA 16S methyltransferase RsmE [Acidisphaera rubrifaciens HS-AP3]|uniref:Ribosomal RNA small subunit methyltransferase E n=2 Tax=Acidisphaera TaxID=50714 RepID=A0A0D6P769_9PROT|nr:ribosomal RNA 16S methyltransferase RsmE [Acidisphaera rubrifaciens HS-AP3]
MAATFPAAMTTSIRLHVRAPLAAGAAVDCGTAQSRYLRTVMRRSTGDAVLLFNGEDGEWQATIETAARDSMRLICRRRTRPQDVAPDVWLAFALLKRDATDLAVRQATELGVARIMPVLTDHGQAARVNTDRLLAIIIEAAEQSERLTLPALSPPVTLTDLLAAWPGDRQLLAAIERLGSRALPAMVGPPCGLLVGPEGGFSARERAQLLRHPAVRALSLGSCVLRAETAIVAGLAQLLCSGTDDGTAAPLPSSAGDR